MIERADRILVAGATGLLGRELVQQLKARGYFVRAHGRNAAKLRALCPAADEWLARDILTAPELRSVCQDASQVVSCLGASVLPMLKQGRQSFMDVDLPANLRLAKAAQAAGVRRFVYLSVFTDGRLAQNDFVRSHEEVVGYLRMSQLPYAVIRSTGLFGSLVQIMREASWGLVPEYGSGESQTNPIHEADLAAFCSDLLGASGDRLEYAVGGPQVLTRRQIAALVLQRQDHSLGRRTWSQRGLRVPVSTLRAAGWLLGPVNRRVSQLMKFIAGVLSDNFVAPVYGCRTLAQYVEAETQNTATASQRPSSNGSWYSDPPRNGTERPFSREILHAPSYPGS